ncbi:hypothetical protein Tco_1568776 [Tanacetum coccineum]
MSASEPFLERLAMRANLAELSSSQLESSMPDHRLKAALWVIDLSESISNFVIPEQVAHPLSIIDVAL